CDNGWRGVTGVGHCPKVARHVKEPIFVRTKAADGARCWVEPLLAVRVAVVNGKRALTGIVDVQGFRQGIIVEPARGRVRPLFVRRQGEVLSSLARQPGCVGMRVAQADPDHRDEGKNPVSVELWSRVGYS